MPTLTVNGVPLAYDEAGRGEPLLLLHAGIVDRRMWDDVLPTFAARFRVVRFDLRGYGETPLPDGPFVYGADAAELLRLLGIERAHVVGVSMGGHVALDLALARPELVDGLVVVATGIGGWEFGPAMKAGWADEEAAIERGDLDEAAWINVRMWLDGPSRGPDEVDPALRRRVFEMQRRALDYENPAAEGGWLVPERHLKLGQIASPTLVAVGELDQPDFVRIARHVAEAIPGSRLQVLPGVAHLPPMEAPQDFASLVVEFLTD